MNRIQCEGNKTYLAVRLLVALEPHFPDVEKHILQIGNYMKITMWLDGIDNTPSIFRAMNCDVESETHQMFIENIVNDRSWFNSPEQSELFGVPLVYSSCRDS